MTPRTDIRHLEPPELVCLSHWEDSNEIRVANWITPWDFQEPIDVGIIAVPIARAAIKPVSTNQGPNAMRAARFFFTTYTVDYDVDICDIVVRDIGDVEIPLWDIHRAHENIREASRDLFALEASFFPIFIGGDHSMTRPIVSALHEVRNLQMGLIQFDAHMDVQNFEDGGPHNGTPIRGVIEDDNGIRPENIAQVGISGFVNAKYYRDWFLNQGGSIFSSREIATRGMASVLVDALEVASTGVDGVYVTVDIDCLELAFSPGTGASITGGMDPWPLMEAVYRLGADRRVICFDLVEVDPARDVGTATARLASKLLLTFLAGYHERA